LSESGPLGYLHSNVVENREWKLVEPPDVLLNQRQPEPVFARLGGRPNEDPVLRVGADLHSGIKYVSVSFEHRIISGGGM